MTPGRVLANVKMAGHYGNELVSTLNLKVAKVLEEEQVIMLKGAVPGPRNGIVTVRHAVKAKKPAA